VTLENPLARRIVPIAGFLFLGLAFLLTHALQLSRRSSWIEDVRLELVQPHYRRVAVAKDAESHPQWVEVGNQSRLVDAEGRPYDPEHLWPNLLAAAGKRVRVKADWESSTIIVKEIELTE
jgi:hypothetical protein